LRIVDLLRARVLQSLLTDALTQGKTLGLQSKQRGAVVLRKALDKLAADFEKVCVARTV
jgi:hypothetical protein